LAQEIEGCRRRRSGSLGALSFAVSESGAASRGRRPTAPPSVRRGTQVAAVRTLESPRATRHHQAAPGAAGSDRCRRCVLS